ncbi:MAG: SDR family oxidoreductase [Gemmatimonadaceae bacterium]
MPGPVYLVTGATGLLGGRVVRRLLRADPAARVVALAREPARWAARASALGLPAHAAAPLAGDLTRPGLGLDAAARARLAREVTGVLHLAADTTFSRPLDEARAVNGEGTRRLLELAGELPAAGRVAFVSTAFVAGRLTGRVPEAAHDGAAGWVNAYEQSKWEAEGLVRAWGDDARREWVILRSSTVVCDDAGGGVTQLNAVHRALRLYHGGLAAMMPGTPESALDVVPADYVADAVAALAFRHDLAGQTLHLCAGDRAYPLDALLDETYELWARCPAWRRKGIARPALTDAATYARFEGAVEETGDARLRGVTRSLSHFIPQLALPKRFDTTRADRALGRAAPAPREYWGRMIGRLIETGWRGGGAPSGGGWPAAGGPPHREGSATAAGTDTENPRRAPGAPHPDLHRDFVERMLEWLNARFAPPGVTITSDTPLFRSRLIDSIRILELIAWTERATGREVPDAEIRMDNFHTVARIADAFARDDDDAEAAHGDAR